VPEFDLGNKVGPASAGFGVKAMERFLGGPTARREVEIALIDLDFTIRASAL
jgi:hypothetical protein